MINAPNVAVTPYNMTLITTEITSMLYSMSRSLLEKVFTYSTSRMMGPKPGLQFTLFPEYLGVSGI